MQDDKEYDILWAAEEGKLHELKELQSKEYDFHVVDWVSDLYIRFNVTAQHCKWVG